jgi:hypothetical protein
MEHTNQTIENLLQNYQLALGKDFDKYRNHVYRVFLNCLLIDSKKINEEKYAIAAVFHDVGIWTNQTIDYLDPSVEQARVYLNETGKQDWINEIIPMIKWHHKITRYQGVHSVITENFRKADWMDVSFGLINFGSDREKIKNNRKRFSNLGFHFFLIKKLVKNFFQHPLNPLPMFKK